MRQQLSRAVRIGLIAISIVSVSGSAFAQAPAAPATPAQPAGATQPLSLEAAIKLALENNLNLRVEKINPELQDLSIAQARTAWTPNLTSTVRNGRTVSPVTSFLAGASGQLTRDSLSANVGANQLLPWGANYTVLWDLSRGKSNSIYDSPNPSLASNLNVNFTQPLLRNRGIDNARQQLLVTKMNREISDVSLRQTVLQTIRNVKYAYWNLKAAVAAQIVAQQSLDLAKESLRNNRSRVEIGTMAPIDIVEAEAEVARRDEAAIVAESTVRRAEDSLRTLILDPKSATFWAVRFELSDQPTFAPTTVDVEGAVKAALEKRTDLRAARKNLELTESNVKFQRNQILPDVNAQVAYGLSGSGGTEIQYGEGGFPPPIIGEVREGFGKVLSRLFSNDFHGWSLTLNFSYPIGTSVAEANLARTRLQLSQARIQMQNLELQVTSSVRDIARQVETNQKRVASTQATERLMARRLEAEQKKYAAGMSTTFLVFQAQRDLSDARYSALAALLNYNTSLVDLETVQEAPTAGGATISVGTSGGQ
jgi:outer membrane protein